MRYLQFLIFTVLILLVSKVCAQDIQGPRQVRIGVNLINITDISEKQETIDFDAIIYMKWRDPSIAYVKNDSLNSNENEYRLYQGDYSILEVFQGWKPGLLMANGIGDRTSNNKMLKVWPDGTAEYTEAFSTTAETPMNLRKFPFDQQKLEVFIHPFNYHRNEVIFIPDDSLNRTWSQNLGIADWTRQGITIYEQPASIEFYDGSSAEVSELVIAIDVKRKPRYILLGIILPMIILIALTWVVFWMDEESVSSRIGISFTGILSVVAYYLVIQGSIPEINYATLIDAFILYSFIILAASVVVSIIVDKLNRSDRKVAGDKLDRHCRWLFPLVYVVGSLALGLFFVLRF